MHLAGIPVHSSLLDTRLLVVTSLGLWLMCVHNLFKQALAEVTIWQMSAMTVDVLETCIVQQMAPYVHPWHAKHAKDACFIHSLCEISDTSLRLSETQDACAG